MATPAQNGIAYTAAQMVGNNDPAIRGTYFASQYQVPDAIRAGAAGLQGSIDRLANSGVPSAPASNAAANSAARAAAAAEASRMNALRNSVGLGQDNAVSTANAGVGGYRDTYRLQNQGVVNAFRNATNSYNSGRENAALNLRRGIQGVTQGVRQGLQGAVAGLPDSALDSGASGALARSWNKQGQQQAAGIYNENALTLRDLDKGYQEAQFERDQALGNLGVDRGSKVDAISSQLYNDLRTLDINAQGQGLNGAVNYGLRDNVINNAIAQLNAIDQDRSAQLGGIQALGQDQILANAVALDQAGAQVYNPYTLPTEEAVVADELSPISALPFYSRRRDI